MIRSSRRGSSSVFLCVILSALVSICFAFIYSTIQYTTASRTDALMRLTGISLLSFPGEDPVRTRGQAFSGRAAECVEEALSAAGARPCLTPSGLAVVPASGLPVSMELTEEDLIDLPSRAGNRYLIVRTRPVGWPLGKRVSVFWGEESAEGIVVERSVDADNTEGKWESELMISIRNEE